MRKCSILAKENDGANIGQSSCLESFDDKLQQSNWCQYSGLRKSEVQGKLTVSPSFSVIPIRNSFLTARSAARVICTLQGRPLSFLSPTPEQSGRALVDIPFQRNFESLLPPWSSSFSIPSPASLPIPLPASSLPLSYWHPPNPS